MHQLEKCACGGSQSMASTAANDVLETRAFVYHSLLFLACSLHSYLCRLMYTDCCSKSIQVLTGSRKKKHISLNESMTTEAAHLKNTLFQALSGDIHLHLIGHNWVSWSTWDSEQFQFMNCYCKQIWGYVINNEGKREYGVGSSQSLLRGSEVRGWQTTAHQLPMVVHEVCWNTVHL